MQESLFIGELNKNSHYKVLARKYRPKSFNELIGQDVLVQTLTNAVKMNRFPHAILLTGIRGVGKTTTARIIAKLMNCINLDLQSIIPCEKCHSCISIAASQYTDVLEMDAASNTSVSDIRAIIENAYYAPVSSRYKIYIIDEIHMLSISAFNALLKILEEPPQHLIFVFATTEIQKIPLTILSRCQRFDLRRIPNEILKNHFMNISKIENFTIEDDALDLIIKAADGSVRDGLSILDQAIALSNGIITNRLVQNMLCINNKVQIIELFTYLASGEIQSVLNLANNLYNSGADPIMIVNQLLELVHEISKSKVLNDKTLLLEFTSQDVKVIKPLQIPFLSRSWQVLLKGLEEIKLSTMPMQALEMLLIRLCYLNVSKTPEEILKQFNNSSNATIPTSNNVKTTSIESIDDLLSALYERNELDLYYILHNEVALVELQHGVVKINCLNYQANNFVQTFQKKLKEITAEDWIVEVVQDQALTIGLQKKQEQDKKKAAIKDNEIVKEILNNFTGSKIIDIKVW